MTPLAPGNRYTDMYRSKGLSETRASSKNERHEVSSIAAAERNPGKPPAPATAEEPIDIYMSINHPTCHIKTCTDASTCATMPHMHDITYRVDTTRINLMRWEYTIWEHWHLPHTKHYSVQGRGTALTESAARRKATRHIRRRQKKLAKPVEVWA